MSSVTVRPADTGTAGRRTPPVLVAAAAIIAAAAVAVGVLGWLVLAWWAGLAAAAAVALVAWLGVVAPRLRDAEERALRLLGPVRPADPRAEARLLNLVEGLSPAAGLARPRVLVIDDPAPNALALGRDGPRGCVIATTGLLGALDRMQLEAVVAELLVQVRDGMTAAPTVALAFRPTRAPDPAPLARADAAAVALTRYPPGLGAALAVLAASGPAAPAGTSAVLGRLWLAPPGDAVGLAARIETLAEL